MSNGLFCPVCNRVNSQRQSVVELTSLSSAPQDAHAQSHGSYTHTTHQQLHTNHKVIESDDNQSIGDCTTLAAALNDKIVHYIEEQA